MTSPQPSSSRRSTRLVGIACATALGCSGSSATDAGTTTGDAAVATSGALPAGFTSAVGPSSSIPDISNYGHDMSLAFDAMGDPALAYLWIDPNGDGAYTDTALYFAHWNHATGRFDAPVMVATVGENFRDVHLVSLAFDTSTSTFGIAYATTAGTTYDVGLAFSTNGRTFTTAALGRSETAPIAASLALAGGTAHLAYSTVANASYATGAETAAPSGWTVTVATAPPDTANTAGEPSIALDTAGRPAIAYLAPPTSGYDMRAIFWRPGAGTQVVAFDSNNSQNDAPHLSLAFRGTAPVIAAQLGREGAAFDVLLASSTDGTTWSAPVALPPDPGASSGIVALAVGRAGQAAVAYDPNGGSGSDACGNPKLSRSTDLATWSTCSPDTTGALLVDPYAPAVGFGAGDKLVVAFSNVGTSTDGALGAGVWVWREP